MAIDFPNSPVEGQVFSVGPMSWTYTGGVWQATVGGGRAIVSDTAPANPVVGDLWFESDTGSLFVYYDGFWVEVGYPASPIGGGRNRVINGAFDVWQRGGGPHTSNAIYASDMWMMNVVGSSNTVTRQTFTPGNPIPGYEPRYWLRAVVASVAGAGNFASVKTVIEGARTLAGQQVTVSFWAKADAVKSVAIEFQQSFGTGGSPSADVSSIGSQKVLLSTAWARYIATVTLPSISGKTFGTDGNDRVEFRFWLDAGSNFNARSASLGQQSGTFDIWGVQIEAGGAATPFEHRPVGEELPRCERYFQRISQPSGLTNLVIGTGMVIGGSSQVVMPLQHNVSMRVPPTAFISANSHWAIHDSGGTGKALVGFSQQRSSTRQTYVFLTASGLTAGQAATLVLSDGTGFIDFSAEF